MYSTIVFDVNETLLDLKALDPAFNDHFGPGDFRRQWFNEVLKLAFVSTIVGNYSDFGVIGRAALEVLEKRHGKSTTEEQRKDLLSMMRKLPPHTDVPEGLATLTKEGFRLVALTNSERRPLCVQPRRLQEKFPACCDCRLSVDDCKSAGRTARSTIHVPPGN